MCYQYKHANAVKIYPFCPYTDDSSPDYSIQFYL